MSTRAEVKVGTGAGTVYRVPTYDDDVALENFDPSTATTKQIIFKMPGSEALITRDADAVQDDDGIWGLEYTTTAADIAPYTSPTVGGFHQEAGTISIEGYVAFSAAQEWASSTVTKDQQDRPLRVVARLSA